MNSKKIKILNILFDNITEEYFLNNCHSGLVVTPNVDFFIHSHKDKEFYEILKSADYVLCDSQLIMMSSRFLSKKLVQKLSGSDIFPKFCLHHKNNDHIKIFLMGAMPGVADKAAEKINKDVGREIVVGSYSPKFGYENDINETEKMIKMFNDSGANVFALGTGCPKSEKWFYQHKSKINESIMFCIGATIDFQAGNINRAPKILSVLCLEWLWRLIKEPRRLWRRYLLEDPLFFYWILKEKLGMYKDPMG